jgi:multidrug efflux pump subunit AcrA (membrane-fusion protein)
MGYNYRLMPRKLSAIAATHRDTNPPAPLFRRISRSLKRIGAAAAATVERRPLVSFFSLLLVLLVLIAAGNAIRKPKTEPAKTVPAKTVTVYRIGKAPVVSMQAQIDKSGVVQVTAQTSGVVQNLYANEGQTVAAGSWIAGLSTTYQGGNAMSVSRQLAEKQNQLTEQTYPIQKDIISKQRDIANQTETNFDKMRDITNQAVSDTQATIDLNNDILSTLETNLQNLEASPSGNETLILTTKQLKSQFQSANLQLNASLRNAKYQADSSNPPSTLAALQRDIALRQLDMQETSLNLNREISKLQLTLARINEGLMFPSAPFAARVERMLIRVGQNVTPGTPIALLSGTTNRELTATVFAPKDVADSVSRLEPTTITVGKTTVSGFPTTVSREAVAGGLYAIVYTLPDGNYGDVADKSYVTAAIPVGYADTGTAMPFVPLDSVYQTRESAYLFVADNGHAVTRNVVLGGVYGRFVQVVSGIKSGDAVILERTVIDSDTVSVK